MNMKNLKRMLCWILAVTMVLGLLPSTVLANGSSSFKDVKDGDWFKEAVEYVTAEGLMVGVGGNKFDPNGQTTRAMVVTVLYRMEGEPETTGTGFSDTGKHRWYSKAVIWAKENSIVNGYGDDTFRPDVTMTREEMVAVFYRYAAHKDYDTSANASLSQFTDHKSIQSYAKSAVGWAVAVGLVQGFPDDTFCPRGDSTRAQLATILMRFHENVQNKQFTVTFETNGGTAIEPQYVRNGKTAIEPEVPTKEEHRFVAWYVDSELSEIYDFTQPVTRDVVLYAGWKEVGGMIEGDSGTSVDVYAITDFMISEDETTANAVVSAPENCVLVVRFMDEEIYFSEDYPNNKEYIDEENLFASHVVRGGTDMEEVVAEIVGTLPEYYVAEAILLDGEGNALCNPFSYIDNTKKFEEYEQKTVYDFGEETVLKFAEETDNNFGVLAADVKTIIVTDLIVNEETNVHSLIGLNEELQAGDKVFINDGTDQALIRVGSITKNETETDILPARADDENFGFDLYDFYTYIKVDMDYEGDMSSEESEPASEKPATRWEVVDVDKNKEVTLKLNPISFETKHFKVNGGVTGSISANLVMKWDVKAFAKDYMRCDFTYTSKVNPSLTVMGEIGSEDDEKKETEQREIKIGKVSIPFGVTGLSAFGEFKFKVDWSLSGGLSVSGNIETTQGFKYNTKDGYQKVEKKKSTWSVNCEGHAELKFGPATDLGIEFLEGVLEVKLEVFLGGKAEATAAIPIFQGGDSKHACYICINGNMKAVISADVKLQYHITEKLSGTPIDLNLVTYEKELFKFFVSVHNDSDSPFKGKLHFGKGDCTNIAYKTVLKACDENGNPLTTQITVTKKADNSNAGSVQSGDTLYLYAGHYVATANIDGASVSRSFTVSEDAQTVVITKNSGDGSISGVVRNAKDNSGIQNAKVTVYKQTVVCGEAVTDASGSYKITLPEGTYRYEITAEKFISVDGYVEIADGEEKYMEATLMAADDDDSIMGGIFGTIKDARTGLPISGVKIQVYYGANNTSGNNAATDIPWYTDTNGKFSYKKWSVFGADFGLPAGNYTLILSKDEYISTSYNVVIEGGKDCEFNGSISPVSAQHEYRIVLSWGSSPSDLDSHYSGLTKNGYIDHVYYSRKSGYTANLDIDDTSSYGPETIYVSDYEDLVDGFYYSVHDYSNCNTTYGSYALANSNATVRLYQGQQLLKTYYVPTGREGTVWNVFSITGDGRITAINTMEYNTNPSNVGSEFIYNIDYDGEIFEDVRATSDPKPVKEITG